MYSAARTPTTTKRPEHSETVFYYVQELMVSIIFYLFLLDCHFFLLPQFAEMYLTNFILVQLMFFCFLQALNLSNL